MGAQVQVLPDYICASVENITNVMISEDSQLTSIGANAFYNNKKLSIFTLPAQLQTIGSSAFYNCVKLTTIINYSSLKLTSGSSEHGYVAYYATIITNSADNIIVIDEVHRIDMSTQTYLAYLGSDVIITIPDIVKHLGNYVFAESDIQQIVLPSSLQTIGDSVFHSCSELTNITIPASVTSIGNSAFWGCSKLQTVTFAEGSQLQTIGSNAFRRCSALTSITIPASVTSIGNYAFFECDNLAIVINYSSLPLVAGSSDYGYVAYYANYVGDGTGLELIRWYRARTYRWRTLGRYNYANVLKIYRHKRYCDFTRKHN